MFRGVSLVLLGVYSLTAWGVKDPCPELLDRPNRARLTFAALNVENLFDTIDDRRTDDRAFLPAESRTVVVPAPGGGGRKPFKEHDWTRNKLRVKLANLQRLFGEYGHVDMLSALELESETSTNYLAKAFDFDQFSMTRSPDERGMDVAALFNESRGFIAKYTMEHSLDTPEHPTRNILEVGFKVNGVHRLIVFINHWPSQFNPTADRAQAAKTLRRVIDQRLKAFPDARVLALGDFNVTDKDTPSPFDLLLKDGAMVDVEARFRADPTIAQAKKDAMPPATYYYDREYSWNHLDRVFVSANALEGKGLNLDLPSFRIMAPSFATKQVVRRGEPVVVPLRYNFETEVPEKAGFTDHFGIKFDFVDRDIEPLVALPTPP